jgi:hypothetical protein
LRQELNERTLVQVKTLGIRCLVAAVLFASVIMAFAGPFQSVTLGPGSSLPLQVADSRFLVIRNFTQEGGTSRGVVTVTTDSGTANVLTAAILDSGASSTTIPLEVISNVVIAGPATVNVTCAADATDCFITYRKNSN